MIMFIMHDGCPPVNLSLVRDIACTRDDEDSTKPWTIHFLFVDGEYEVWRFSTDRERDTISHNIFSHGKTV